MPSELTSVEQAGRLGHGLDEASDRHRIETLRSQFGRSTLTEITPDRVDRYRSDRLTTKRKGKKRTISPMTVNKEVALLKAMLNRAIAWGLLDTNPRTSGSTRRSGR